MIDDLFLRIADFLNCADVAVGGSDDGVMGVLLDDSFKPGGVEAVEFVGGDGVAHALDFAGW